MARRLPLPGKPTAHLKGSDGSVLVVAGHFLVQITKDWKVMLLHDGEWRTATSLAKLDDGTLFIGERNAVVRLLPGRTGYEEVWFSRPWEPGEQECPVAP